MLQEISPLPSPKRLRAGRSPLFAKSRERRDSLLPAAPALARRVKGGKEGFSLQCPYNYELINNSQKNQSKAIR